MDIETSYLIFWTVPDYVHYGVHYYIVYVTCSRLIVLYSRYRINYGTNMFVVFVNATLFLFLLPVRLGFVFGISKSVGRSPPCRPLHNNICMFI